MGPSSRATCWFSGLAWFVVLTGVPVMAAHRVSTPEFHLQYWTRADGLPDDFVTSLQQTADGFLWVGTARGLVRFDGWTFIPVRPAPAGNQPPDDVLKVTAQCVDGEGRLWFGTKRHGVFRLAPQAPQPLIAQPVGMAGEEVLCLGAGDFGVVWIGSERGLRKWEGGTLSQPVTTPRLADPAVLGLRVTPTNGVWLTTREGLFQYQDGVVQRAAFDLETTEQKSPFLGIFVDRIGSLWGFGDTYLLNLSEGRRFNYFRGGGATPLHVWSICEGRAGQLWIGTSGQGLFQFSGNRFRAVDLREARDHLDVRAVFVDREGNLWAGSQRGGLLRLQERSVRWFAGPDSAATCLVEDPGGRVWAGFEHGGLWVGRGGLLEPAGRTSPLANHNLISSLYFMRDATCWMGTLGSGLYRVEEGRTLRHTTAHGLTDDTVLAVCGGGPGRVWVSTADGCVHRYAGGTRVTFDTGSGLTGQPVTALTPASPAGVWLGTTRGEVLRFQTSSFTTLSTPGAFGGRPVRGLREDSSGRLWVGTAGGGLGCYMSGQWRFWDTTNGLPDNTVLGIEESQAGELWVATARGVCRLPGDWTVADAAQPFPIVVEFPPGGGRDVEFGWPRSLRSRDGRLWFATHHGVVNFDPAELQPVAAPLPVRIETVLANGQPQSGFVSQSGLPADVPRTPRNRARRAFPLPTALRDLEIRFTTPSLAMPERTRFRHKLEGFDPDWQDSTTSRRARYGRLPAGDYRFLVAASNAEGVWNEAETQLAFVVPPPLWRAPWALALQLLALVSLVAVVVRVASHRRLVRQLARLEEQRAMERERARIARDMHDELGSKLTKISFLSERARNDLPGTSPAGERLDSIARTARGLLHSLDEIVWVVNPRNDTLEHLAGYLGQYTAEYFQNTTVEYDLRMPGALPAHPLSAEARHNVFLAFEEALSNALKHSGASRVGVAMTVANGEFHVRITDNGRGFEAARPDVGSAANADSTPPRRAGTGLRGMRARLTDLGGRCDVVSQPGVGAVITLILPLTAPEKHSA